MKVAVVVPALNEARLIAGTIASVRVAAEHAGMAVDVVVADGGSTDGTPGVAAPLARVITSARGRARQMNAGAAEATGDVLLFLHADSRLAPTALVALRDALRDPAIVGGTYTLRFEPSTPLLRGYAFFTRFPLRLFRYGDQGVFVRREVFDTLGGYADVPLMEDVDFLARLTRAGRTALVPIPVTTSARRFQRHGVIRQQLLNIALVLLYGAGVSPHRLARWYEHVHR